MPCTLHKVRSRQPRPWARRTPRWFLRVHPGNAGPRPARRKGCRAPSGTRESFPDPYTHIHTHPDTHIHIHTPASPRSPVNAAGLRGLRSRRVARCAAAARAARAPRGVSGTESTALAAHWVARSAEGAPSEGHRAVSRLNAGGGARRPGPRLFIGQAPPPHTKHCY